MDLSSIINFVTNPVGAITGFATGIIIFQVYKVAVNILRPAQYIDKLYRLADNVVINIDDRVIDKFLPKRVKKDLQERIIKVLEKRKSKIDTLIQLISD